MKFLKRTAVIRNIIIFCGLSLFYLSVINSLEGGVSALDLSHFYLFLKNNTYLVGLTGVTLVVVFWGFKSSPYILAALCLIVGGQSLMAFSEDLDKVILLLTFLYAIVSFNFILFLRLELKEPFYNPQYPANILPAFQQKNLPVTLKKGANTYRAFLTNWGESGFFARVNQKDFVLKGEVEVEITIEGQTFFCKGEVITRSHGGVGIRVLRNPVPDLGWSDFYGIIKELGYRPTFTLS